MKSLNDFIEEAANSVQRPKCPDGQYYDIIRQKCVVMPAKYGGRYWGGSFHSRSNKNGNGNGNGNGSNGSSNGNGNDGNGSGNGNGGSGGNGGGNGSGGNGG